MSHVSGSARVEIRFRVPRALGTLDPTNARNVLVISDLDDWHSSSGGPVGWPGRKATRGGLTVSHSPVSTVTAMTTGAVVSLSLMNSMRSILSCVLG